MKKTLTVLTALALLFTVIYMPAVQAEETSFVDGMMAFAGMQSQITPEQEQEMMAIVQFLGQDLTEETALAEILSWDKDTILQKLEGYETPLEHFASKEEAAELLAGYVSQIAPLFQMSEGQIMDQAGGIMDTMAGMLDFSSPEDELYNDVSIDGFFNGTYWENGNLKLTSVWQDGYYKILIQDGGQEWIYLCEEDQETGRKQGIGCGDPDQTEAQEDQGIATFYTQWDNNRDEMVWEKADGSKVAFSRIIDPLDETQWYRDGMMITITWRGENAYNLYIQGYTMQEFTVWNYECLLDEDKDVLTGTGTKSTFMGDLYTGAQATFAFSEGRTELTWTDDKEETAKDGLVFEGVDKTLTTAVWEVPENMLSAAVSPPGTTLWT